MNASQRGVQASRLVPGSRASLSTGAGHAGEKEPTTL